MDLKAFALAKLAGWKAPLTAGAAGLAAGAAAVHALDKRHEKKTAKSFYWLGRNTGGKRG
ncbi:MAG: hypothetical protein ABFE07_29200 [Armatimonadia bacterium]